jgi:hypothetical protein
MKLPLPKEQLTGCVWLPRFLAKAKLAKTGQLGADYAARYCHPTGVDAQFLQFFQLTQQDIENICDASEEEVVRWFRSLNTVSDERIQEWNHLACNLGSPGFPMADRLPVALATSYAYLAPRKFDTVFAVLEADEEMNNG